MQMDLHVQMYYKQRTAEKFLNKTNIENEKRIRFNARVRQENAERNTQQR